MACLFSMLNIGQYIFLFFLLPNFLSAQPRGAKEIYDAWNGRQYINEWNTRSVDYIEIQESICNEITYKKISFTKDEKKHYSISYTFMLGDLKQSNVSFDMNNKKWYIYLLFSSNDDVKVIDGVTQEVTMEYTRKYIKIEGFIDFEECNLLSDILIFSSLVCKDYNILYQNGSTPKE